MQCRTFREHLGMSGKAEITFPKNSIDPYQEASEKDAFYPLNFRVNYRKPMLYQFYYNKSLKKYDL